MTTWEKNKYVMEWFYGAEGRTLSAYNTAKKTLGNGELIQPRWDKFTTYLQNDEYLDIRIAHFKCEPLTAKAYGSDTWFIWKVEQGLDFIDYEYKINAKREVKNDWIHTVDNSYYATYNSITGR